MLICGKEVASFKIDSFELKGYYVDRDGDGYHSDSVNLCPKLALDTIYKDSTLGEDCDDTKREVHSLNICDSCAKEPIMVLLGSADIDDVNCLIIKLLKDSTFKSDFSDLLCNKCKGTFKLKFSIDTTVVASDGTPANGETDYKTIPGEIYIKINPRDKKGNRSKQLDFVRTIIHEMYHAKLLAEAYCKGLKLDDLDDSLKVGRYNQTLGRFLKDSKNNFSNAHHDYIAKFFIENMSNMLQNIDSSTNENLNNLYNEKDVPKFSIYEFLPYVGLEYSSQFKEFVKKHGVRKLQEMYIKYRTQDVDKNCK